MSRKIIDEVVERANDERKVLDMDNALYYMYAGNVTKGFPKVAIQRLSGVEGQCSIIRNVQRFYAGIKMNDIPAIIRTGSSVINTDPDVVRICKALYLGQCSRNEEYSVAVADVAKQFTRMCVNCEATLPFEPVKDGTPMQNVVVNELTNWVAEKLNECGIVYTLREDLLETSDVVYEELE